MSKVRIELNSAGVRELLKSAEMAAGLRSIVSGIAAGCGDGYSYDTKAMGTRVVASAFTESAEAMKDNSDNNSILRNLR